MTGPSAGMFARPGHLRAGTTARRSSRRWPGRSGSRPCGAGPARRPPAAARPPAGWPVGHSHERTSSTTSSTLRPVVSSTWASAASVNGDAARVRVDPVPPGDAVGRLVVPAAGPLLGRRGRGRPSGRARGRRPSRCPGPRRPRRRASGAHRRWRSTSVAPDLGVGGHDRDRPADLRDPDRARSRRCRRSGPSTGPTSIGASRRDVGHRVGVGRVDAPVERRPGHRPVHGPGVEPLVSRAAWPASARPSTCRNRPARRWR